MPIEMRYRTERYVVDTVRGRAGRRPAPLVWLPPPPPPDEVGWEDAARTVAGTRRGQILLVLGMGAAAIGGPAAAVGLGGRYEDVVVMGACGAAGAGLAGAALLDRRVRRSIDALARSARALAELAATDPLTELPNHRAFQERLHREFARATDAATPLALVLLDLDHFKHVNDTHGHPAGDRVVREVARRLSACARPGEMVARIGGEEFAWIVPGDAMDAWQAAERARATIEGSPMLGYGRLTISAGICELSQAGSPTELLRLADGALYWAKAHGRNRVIRYSPEVVEELSADERAARLEHQQAMNAVLALARAVDAKDPYTMQHSGRVADMAARVARELGWAPDRLRLLHEAALLHDVGKIGVPDAVLTKDGPLDDAEWALVREHPGRGAEIVADALEPEQVAWVRGHHERHDGRGYPDGLAGEAIPDGARVLALADAWDAMTTDRPYRPGMTPDRALEVCREEAGSQLAPEVVAALERLWQAGAVPGAGEDVASAEGGTPLRYRGVASGPAVRRRERPSASGSGLVYRGLPIADDAGDPGIR